MLYNVGVYVRLSKEDGLDGASMSVENQKEMLSKFIMFMPEWIHEKTYIDDGFSGGSFDRPAFQEMIADARQGKINLVLVKDLSRFGRNYLEAARYLQTILPEAGCRFVSISENIDTAKGETDIMDFMNFINDYYLKDISGRIKTVLTAKAKNGEFLMGCEPYGYIRSENDNHVLVIDETAAAVVRKIFGLRLRNMGYAKIAGELNREGILPPRVYTYMRKGKANPYDGVNLWRDRTIKTILQNEVYIGRMVQQKCGTFSHRTKKVIKKSADEWIRVENTHQPIVDMDTWNRVQATDLKKSDPAKAEAPQTSLFSGMLFCADCKSPMNTNREKQIRKNGKVVRYTSYVCRDHLQTGRAKCSRHCIYEISLKQIVLEDIKLQAQNIVQDERKIVGLLKRKMSCLNKDKLSEMKTEMKKLERRLRELENIAPNLYEDKVNGTISAETFKTLTANSESEKKSLTVQKNGLQTAINDTQNKMNDIQTWVSLIKGKSAIESVDRSFLTDIIDRIEIGERTVVDNTKYQDVKIFYKLVGNTNL